MSYLISVQREVNLKLVSQWKSRHEGASVSYRLGQLVDLHHSLANCGARLLHLGNHGRIIEDPAGNLAVATKEAEIEFQGRLLLQVAVSKGSAVLELLARKDETLLVRGNALLVLDHGLDIIDGVAGLHFKGDSLIRDCGRMEEKAGMEALLDLDGFTMTRAYLSAFVHVVRRGIDLSGKAERKARTRFFNEELHCWCWATERAVCRVPA